MKRLDQGVIRRRIRTNECLGRAQEVPPAAHSSTEALARGGGVFSSRTCNQYILALTWTEDGIARFPVGYGPFALITFLLSLTFSLVILSITLLRALSIISSALIGTPSKLHPPPGALGVKFSRLREKFNCPVLYI